MGITCKPTGTFKRIMRKLENELADEKKLAKEKKEVKKNAESKQA